VLILKVSFVVIVAELVITGVFQGQEIQFNVAVTEQYCKNAGTCNERVFETRTREKLVGLVDCMHFRFRSGKGTTDATFIVYY